MNRHEYQLLGILVNDVFWHRNTENLVDAMDIARREYFSTELGKVIYSGFLRILQLDAVPDLELMDELLSENETYKIGHGRSTLMSMGKDATSSANVIKYAEGVREEYFLRDAYRRVEEAKAELERPIAAKEKIENALSIVGGISTEYDNGKDDCSFSGAVDSMIEHLNEVAKAGSTITGLDTGFARLNQKTHGLQNGNTVVVAGLPGGGKTTFCLNIMAHAAITNKKRVLFYSMEMPKHEISMKVCSYLSNIPMHDFQAANVVSEDHKNKVLAASMEKIKGVNFHIDDDASLTAEKLENRTKRHAMEMGGIDLICLDYLTLMDAQGESETVRATNAAKALKRIAKKFNCPVIIISQFVKNVVGRPTKSDLRQTGQLAQDASLILFLHRDENQVVEDGESKLVELIIDKNRMGETGDLIYEPYFATNKLIESERDIKYPIDSDGNPIKQQKKGLKRVC